MKNIYIHYVCHVLVFSIPRVSTVFFHILYIRFSIKKCQKTIKFKYSMINLI